jgi:hypothetical protein
VRRVSFTTILIVSSLLFGAYLLVRHWLVSDEDRVKAVFARIEKALENRDASSCLDAVSPDYRDSAGRRRSDLRTTLVILFQMTEQVMATLTPRSVLIQSNRAEVELFVSIRIRYNRPVGDAPEEGSEVVRVELRKEDGEWKVTGATYPEEVERRFQRAASRL